MNKSEMRREIGSLASGTLARLFDETNYMTLETYQAKWLEWLDAQPNDKSWDSWVDCWNEYKPTAHLNRIVGGKQLSPFDFQVIAYAESRGESSEAVYERLTNMEPIGYRDQQTEAKLLAKLERLKAQERGT